MKYILLAIMLTGCATPQKESEEYHAFICFVAQCDFEIVNHSDGKSKQEKETQNDYAGAINYSFQGADAQKIEKSVNSNKNQIEQLLSKALFGPGDVQYKNIVITDRRPSSFDEIRKHNKDTIYLSTDAVNAFIEKGADVPRGTLATIFPLK